jgi:hypothetical protein
VKREAIPLPTLLEEMTPIVRSTMLETFRPDCCVATCKILREVFADYGYRAREVPVTVQILNAPSSFFAAKPKGQRISGKVDESLVVYKRLRDDGYLSGRNWRERYAGQPETYFKIVRLLREQIATTQF